MTDKERILTVIINHFYPKYILGMDNRDFEIFKKCSAEAIQVGDLILATTSGIHDFTIGYVVDKKNNHEIDVREIGGTRICSIGNEYFYKIDISELDKNLLLEGEQYLFYEKAKQAIRQYNDENYILMEITFENSIAFIYFRKKWSNYDKNTAPQIKIHYNENTTEKDILNVMKKTLK